MGGPDKVLRQEVQRFLQSNHLAIDLLDSGHERFFALGQADELSKGRARDVSQHSRIFTR